MKTKEEPELDVLALTKFKNLKIWDMKGSKTWHQIAEEAGVSYNQLLKLLGFKVSPMRENGEWTAVAKKLSGYFCVSPEEVFPLTLYEKFLPIEGKLERAFASAKLLTMQEARMQNLLPSSVVTEDDIINDMEARDLESVTEKILTTLNPRQEQVIKLRFGLEDGKERTLEEVSHNFAVDRERIRQIQNKALRDLRHPTRSRQLDRFLGATPWDVNTYYRRAVKYVKSLKSKPVTKKERVFLRNSLEDFVDSHLFCEIKKEAPLSFTEFVNEEAVEKENFDVDLLRGLYKAYIKVARKSNA